jgi:uncharacterized protein YggT (Ycf19 family)
MIGALVYAIGAIIEGIIGLRFLFKLLGANPNSGFVSWIYSWSSPFVAPFKGIFGQADSTSTGTGTAVTGVFDWSALIAFIIVGIIVAIISGAIMRRRRVVV